MPTLRHGPSYLQVNRNGYWYEIAKLNQSPKPGKNRSAHPVGARAQPLGAGATPQKAAGRQSRLRLSGYMTFRQTYTNFERGKTRVSVVLSWSTRVDGRARASPMAREVPVARSSAKRDGPRERPSELGPHPAGRKHEGRRHGSPTPRNRLEGDTHEGSRCRRQLR